MRKRGVLSVSCSIVLMLVVLYCRTKVAVDTAGFHHDDNIRSRCVGDNAQYIKRLEDELAGCVVVMPEAPSTAEMQEAYYKASDCAVNVAHKIFDRYYVKHNKEVKKDFSRLTEAFYACSHDISQKSDFADKHNTGTLYNIEAVSGGGMYIKNFVKNYIRELWLECAEMAEH